MKVYEICRNAAIGLMIFGCVLYMFVLSETKYKEYGGDAYTGIQNAAADTANNVMKASGVVVMALGVVLYNYSNVKVFEYEENEKKHKELLAALSVKTHEAKQESSERQMLKIKGENDESQAYEILKPKVSEKNEEIVKTQTSETRENNIISNAHDDHLPDKYYYKELALMESYGMNQCAFCYQYKEVQVCKMTTKSGVKVIPLCRKCQSKLRKEE